MFDKERVRPTPWDRQAFGVDTFEILTPDEKTLEQIAGHPGHYTVKIDPLDSKKLLHEHNFYYCDTLLQPYADRASIKLYHHDKVTSETPGEIDELLDIADGVFKHGRFHRDFMINRHSADLRYSNWLRQMHAQGETLSLFFEDQLAAFFACLGSHIALHAVSIEFQGKGLAKFLWSTACNQLFDAGHQQLTSSVSAANTAVVNLYASLGFRFHKPQDIYHRMVQ